MSVAVAIPYGEPSGHRDRALNWILSRYAATHPAWPVMIGHCPGLWRKGAAVGRAIAGIEDSHGIPDVIIIADADVWSDRTAEGVDLVRDGAPWVTPFSHVCRLTEHMTAKILSGGALPSPVAFRSIGRLLPADNFPWLEWPYRHRTAGGIVILPRKTALEVPMDPRFEGWGQEDEAWNVALSTLAGPRQYLEGPLWHLYHPPAPRVSREIGSEEGLALRNRYYRACGDPKQMRQVIGE